jgi:hypothetical protein
VGYPGKNEVTCPEQDSETGVLLVIGQSNSANFGEAKFATNYPKNVFNYFDGKCYVASSPLLGAGGEFGEFITPLADKLISAGVYKSVVIVAAGIGASQIARWRADGDLNYLLINTLNAMNEKFRFTEVIWHQGESDFYLDTTEINYIDSFKSLVGSLRLAKVTAPIFISIATKCGGKWYPNSATSSAQSKLVDNKTIFLGSDTDALLSNDDRRSDVCHFNSRGELKVATDFARAIISYKAR